MTTASRVKSLIAEGLKPDEIFEKLKADKVKTTPGYIKTLLYKTSGTPKVKRASSLPRLPKLAAIRAIIDAKDIPDESQLELIEKIVG